MHKNLNDAVAPATETHAVTDAMRVEKLKSSLESSKILNRNLARTAQDLASHPFRNLKTLLQYRLLRFFIEKPGLISKKKLDKFTRLAGRRSPSRFLDFVDSTYGVETFSSSVVSQAGGRSSEYLDYDPSLQRLDHDVKLIAFYLPQFHPFPENDVWWGKGFTEWTNVGKALPLFDGHYQPHCPVHLGYYDLRLPEVMEEQSKIAQQYGIGGFAHHFYWFGGKTLMELPLRNMLENKKVDIPFCLSWANENWTRRWDGKDSEVLIAQDYSESDGKAMIGHLADYFKDDRYIRIDGRPVFLVYRPRMIPDVEKMKTIWQDEAIRLGVGPLYIVGVQSTFSDDFREFGFDASVEFPPHGLDTMNMAPGLGLVNHDPALRAYDYAQIAATALERDSGSKKVFRGITLSWDNTARRRTGTTLVVNFSLAIYRKWLTQLCLNLKKDISVRPDEKLIFINAWNEWAEGTHLEPDQRFGFAYLEATRQALTGPGDDQVP